MLKQTITLLLLVIVTISLAPNAATAKDQQPKTHKVIVLFGYEAKQFPLAYCQYIGVKHIIILHSRITLIPNCIENFKHSLKTILVNQNSKLTEFAVDFSGFVQLKKVFLRGNKAANNKWSLSFKDIPTLESIVISDNDLGADSKFGFQNLPKLTELRLQNIAFSESDKKTYLKACCP